MYCQYSFLRKYWKNLFTTDAPLPETRFWQNHSTAKAKFWDCLTHSFFSKDGDFFIRLNLFTMAQFLLRCLKARNDFSTSFQCMPGEILIESIWYDPAVTEDSHPKYFSQKLMKTIYKYFKRLFQYFVDSKGKHGWHFH